MMASVLSAACMAIGFLVFTISTLTPLVSMGVITMKMISSTSITSTMGVTLISATGGGALNFFFSPVIAFSPDRWRKQGPLWAGPLLNSPDPIRYRARLLLAGADATLRTLQEVIDQFGAGVTH